MLKNVSIRIKLIAGFLVVGLLPMIVISILSLNSATETLHSESINKLSAIRTIKKNQIEQNFKERVSDASEFAKLPFIASAIKNLDKYSKQARYRNLSGKKLLNYKPFKREFNKHYSMLKNFSKSNGYDNIFLISPNSGRILISSALDDDFGTELKSEDTHLAIGWQELRKNKKIVITDMKTYAPSNGAPKMFVIAPSFRNGKYIGAVALQISSDTINRIMQERTGMGKSGESYLVGSDFRMRSDSSLNKENYSIKASFNGTIEKNGKKSIAVEKALAGEKGMVKLIDYTGNSVLSVYETVKIGSLTWAIISKINVAEVEESVKTLKSIILVIGIIFSILIVAFAFLFSSLISNGIKNVISQFNKLIKDVVDGKLKNRGNSEDVLIDFKEIVEGNNKLIDAFVNPINIMIEYTYRISKGDLPEKITDHYDGDFNTLKNNLNQCIDAVSNLVNGANEFVHYATLGEIEKIDLDESKMLGAYKEIFVGLNRGANVIVSPLLEVLALFEKMALGNFSTQMVGDYKGGFLALKEAVNKIIYSMNKVTEVSKEIANGNLTINAEERSEQDELMKAMKLMIKNLSKVAIDVQTAASQVATGSEETSSLADEMAQSANEQSASVEQVSSSMEEMNSSVIQNADNAKQTASISEKVAKDAIAGGDAVNETVHSMKTIAEKIAVIEDIANQTNMLALNAAIEAARAGDHGKGFAVVASEVRNLAERSGVAAKEINDLSKSSVEVAEKAGNLIKEMVPQIQKTAELVREISASAGEQATGIEQVTTAVEQLDKGIQQNAAATEEVASTTEELSSQAAQLQETSKFFKVENNSNIAITTKSVKTKLKVKPKENENLNKVHITKESDGFEIELDDDKEFERY